ncbi:unnamed protein product [Closterium sp. NIES-65]|nr:unnamed protein product [Closterium sp. NIES-65]
MGSEDGVADGRTGRRGKRGGGGGGGGVGGEGSLGNYKYPSTTNDNSSLFSPPFPPSSLQTCSLDPFAQMYLNA